MAIEDRLLTDNDVRNIANILRGEPIEEAEIEAEKADEVEVEKIELKPIEKKVIDLAEIYKAKVASGEI